MSTIEKSNSMARKKKTVTPAIMGIHPQGERKKKLLALHFHPDAIRENVKGMVEMSAEQPELRPLFEDIQVLVNWALDRLPLATPPKEKEVQSSEEESTSEPK